MAHRWPLTYDEAHLTQGVLVAAGHHGANGVVDQRHHVQVKLLWAGTRGKASKIDGWINR